MPNQRINEYYKVSFVTTHSGNLPNMIKHTGALIVMSDLSKEANGRKSLWLHGDCVASGWGLSSKDRMQNCEWMSLSYNKVFAPLDDEGKNGGMGYFLPEEGVQDLPKYTYDGNNLVGKPQSVKSWITYSIDFAYDSYSYVLKYAGDIHSQMNNNKNEFDKAYTYLKDYIDSCYENALDNVQEEKTNTYHYIDDSISRIVGGAPDYLDSLKEIKEYIDRDMQNATNMLDKVLNSDKYAIKREDAIRTSEDGTKYTYIAENFTYKYLDTENPKTYTYTYVTYAYNPSDGTYTEVSNIGTYTYYNEVEANIGNIALEGKQVNVGGDVIGDHQLTDIIERLLIPYDYKKPSVESTTVAWDDIENINEYNTQSVAIPEVSANILKNDAKGLESVRIIPTDSTIMSTKSIENISQNGGYINIKDSIESISPFSLNIKSKEDAINAIMKEQILAEYLEVFHTESNICYYPQLEDLKIEDRKGAFKSGSFNAKFDSPISTFTSFKMYYGNVEREANIPLQAEDFRRNQVYSCWIKSKEHTEKITIRTNNPIVWIAIPSYLLDNSRVEVESYSSGIKMDMTNMNTNVMQENMTPEYPYNNTTNNIMNYRTLYLHNLQFMTFADTISITINF